MEKVTAEALEDDGVVGITMYWGEPGHVMGGCYLTPSEAVDLLKGLVQAVDALYGAAV